MSKAFTRESDDSPDDPSPLRPVSSLPPGAKNYLTADGARRLRLELDHLIQIDRPQAAALPDPDTARRRGQLLDQRIAALDQSLRSAVIVSPPAGPEEKVRFGTAVTVRDRSGQETTCRIVGVDETDPERGWVSWCSPVARALLNGRVGQRVRLQLPEGDQELEILRIGWPSVS